MSNRVITFGTFDLFHIGHLNILMRAADLGEQLIVGVSTDALNYSKKGFYPVFSQHDRIAIVRALSVVNHAFFEESLERKAEYIRQFEADILVMGDDWEGRFDYLRSICKVVYLPRTKGISTTEIKQGLARELAH